MQIRAFSERSCKTTKACLSSNFERVVSNFLHLLSIYIPSRFKISLQYFYPRKEGSVLYIVEAVKAVTIRVYIFIGCRGILLKEKFFVFVTLNALFGPVKSERGRRKH